MNAPASARTAWFAPRRVLALVALAALVSIVAGLYLQQVVGLKPCPLCVLQRVGYIAIGFGAALGALAAHGTLRWFGVGLAAAGALGGGAVAIRHNLLLLYPPEAMSCGRPFEWFNDDFPLVVWLPRLLRGDGDCLDVSWKLLGLAVPQWSALAFAGLLVAILWAALGLWRARR